MGRVTGADLLRDAVAELYSSDPDGFVERRGVLAAQAREAGQAPVARQIAALRKPTRSAWVVNRLVQAAPEVPGELASLGDELLAAQRSLDGAAIRELSQQRRQLIEALVRQAFTVVGLHSPPAGLRDEVATTLEAALADPQVARQLAAGTLARAARSEGFGLAGPPVLSLVQGGGSGPATTETSGRPGAAQKRAGAAGQPGEAGKQTGAAGRPRASGKQAEAGSRTGAGSRAGAAGKATVQAQASGREQVRAEARARAAEARAEAEARQERERHRQEVLAEAEQAVTETARAAQDATAQEQEQESLVERLEVQLADARQRLAEVRFAARRARNRQRQAGQALDRLRK